MVVAEKRVGRLMELRVRGAVGAEEVAAFRSLMVDVLRGLDPDEKVIAIADFRGVRVVPTALAETMVMLLRATNSRLDRAAVIVSDEPVARMQTQRILDDAHHPGRKMVFTVEEASEWLRPVATAAELARLQRFLDEA